MNRPSSNRFAVVTLTVMLISQITIGQPQTNPRDLPPSPFAPTIFSKTMFGDLQALQHAEESVKLAPVNPSEAEKKVLEQVEELRTKLATLEAAVYAKDPWLQRCEYYVNKAHDWVQNNHNSERNATAQYLRTTDPTEAGQRQKTHSALTELLDMTLFKELGGNTNFAPLLKGQLDAMAEKAPALVAEFLSSVSRNDKLLGFVDPSPPIAIKTFEQYLAQMEKRYAACLSKIAEIQRDRAVPPEVVAGIHFGEMYRLLDGSAGNYIDFRTPPELSKLRQELKRNYFALFELQKPAGSKQ